MIVRIFMTVFIALAISLINNFTDPAMAQDKRNITIGIALSPQKGEGIDIFESFNPLLDEMKITVHPPITFSVSVSEEVLIELVKKGKVNFVFVTQTTTDKRGDLLIVTAQTAETFNGKKSVFAVSRIIVKENPELTNKVISAVVYFNGIIFVPVYNHGKINWVATTMGYERTISSVAAQPNKPIALGVALSPGYGLGKELDDSFRSLINKLNEVFKKPIAFRVSDSEEAMAALIKNRKLDFVLITSGAAKKHKNILMPMAQTKSFKGQRSIFAVSKATAKEKDPTLLADVLFSLLSLKKEIMHVPISVQENIDWFPIYADWEIVPEFYKSLPKSLQEELGLRIKTSSKCDK